MGEAAAVADAYTTLHDEGKRRFLSMLAREFWIDPDVVNAAIDARHASAFSDEDAKRRADRALRESLTPSAAELLHLFAGLEGGVKFLVDECLTRDVANRLTAAGHEAVHVADMVC